MENGLNNHLKRIASELRIKDRGIEHSNIKRSIESVKRKLKMHFGNKLEQLVLFGSYHRDTILRHCFDKQSDIDLLVVFSVDDGKRNPETYRTRLLNFARQYLGHGLIIKDHPSIVVQFTHIKIDLVAAVIDRGVIYDSIDIPAPMQNWKETEPNSFSKKLSNRNRQFNSLVKPIIRLLKYWNASHNYPYQSFILENLIAELDYAGDNLQSGLGYAIHNLSTAQLSSANALLVEKLRKDFLALEQELEKGHHAKAKQILKRILPKF